MKTSDWLLPGSILITYSLPRELPVNVGLGQGEGGRRMACLLNTRCELETALDALHVLIHLTHNHPLRKGAGLTSITHTRNLRYREQGTSSGSHSWEVLAPRSKPKPPGSTGIASNFYPGLSLKSVSTTSKQQIISINGNQEIITKASHLEL